MQISEVRELGLLMASKYYIFNEFDVNIRDPRAEVADDVEIFRLQRILYEHLKTTSQKSESRGDSSSSKKRLASSPPP